MHRLLTALALAGWAAAAQGDLQNGACTLTLPGLSQDGNDVVVHLRAVNGRFRQAWASMPPDEASYFAADAKGLTAEGGKLAGTLAVTIRSVRYDCRLAAEPNAPGRLAGAFRCVYGDVGTTEVKGALSGDAAPAADITGPLRLELDFGQVFGSGPELRCLAALTLDKGQVTDVKLHPAVKAKVPRWVAIVTGSKMDLRGVELSGEIQATISSFSGVREGGYVFKLDGAIACNAVLGTVEIRSSGETGGAKFDRLFGSVLPGGEAKPAPGEVLRLMLPGAVEGDKPLRVHLYVRDGKVAGAAAFAPECSGVMHRVGVGGLKIADGKVAGELAVKIEYDGQFPRHGRDVPCMYELDAAVRDGRIAGSFAGGYGVAGRRSGTLTARLKSWDDLARENALARGIDWPCWRGPTGSGSGPDSGRKLVGNFWRAHLAWKAEESDIPHTWDWHRNGAGGYSDFSIVAGRACMFYYWPAGGIVHQAAYDHIHKDAGIPLSETGQRMYYLIEADDYVLSIDAATGRTLWKTIFRGRGLNHGYVHSRASPQNTPCGFGGRVLAMGTSGNMYALDAATGEPLWDSDVGDWAVVIDQFKQAFAIPPAKAVYERSGKDFALDGIGALACSSPTFADGVVACNDHGGGKRAGRYCGLVGFDAATGRRLWRVPNCLDTTGTSPVRWLHRGKGYFIAACNARAVGVEPRTGRLLWEVTGQVHHSGTPTACEDYVFLNGGTNTHGDSGFRYGQKGPVCLRIDPNGAQVAWEFNAERFITGTNPSQVIVGGDLYAILARRGRGFTDVRVRDGKVNESLGGGGGYGPVAADRRIVTDSFSVIPLDPNERRQSLQEGVRSLMDKGAGVWQAPPKAAFVPFTLCDGRVVLRGVHSAYCYDLRSLPGSQPAGAALADPAHSPSVFYPPAPPAASRDAGSAAASTSEASRLLGDLSSPYLLVRQDAVEQLKRMDAAKLVALTGDLLRMLERGDWYAKTGAAALLEHVGPAAAPMAAAPLGRCALGAVSQPRKGLADLAAAAILKVDPAIAAQIAPQVARLLTGGDERTVPVARGVLEILGPAAAPAGEELAALVAGRDAARAAAACRALAAIGPAAGPQAVAALRRPLGGADIELSRQAARALTAMGPAAAPAVSELAALLDRDDPLLVTQAALALAAVGDAAAPVVPAVIAAYQRASATGRSEKGSRVLLWGLTTVLVNTSSSSLDKLAVALRDGDRRDEVEAVGQVLRRVGDQGVEQVIEAVRSCRDPAQLRSLSNLLASFGPKAVPAIEEALKTAKGPARETLSAVLHDLKMQQMYGPRR